MSALTLSVPSVRWNILPRLGILLGAACLLVPHEASALDAIGSTLVVEGQMSGTFSGRTLPLAGGDGVVSDEIVRTQATSDGQIGFVDETKLYIGPLSSVTLDRLVFDASGGASKFTVDVTKGALRFVSGRSPKGVYRVNVPFGSLGLRGTVVDTVVERRRVIVTVKEGSVVVTPTRGAPVTLIAGQSAILTNAGVTGPLQQQASGLPDFAAACGTCVVLVATTLPTPDRGSSAHDPGMGGGGNTGSNSSSSSSR
jgi:hypothetical protein